MDDRVAGEGLVPCSQLLEGLDKVAGAQSLVVPARPPDEAHEESAPLVPLLRQELHVEVVADHRAARAGRVREVHAIFGAFSKRVHRPLDVPSRVDEGLDHGAVHVGVSVEGEAPGHYWPARLARCSALRASNSSSHSSLALMYASISSVLS